MLYRACAQSAQCSVLISGGDVDQTGASEAAVYAAVLRQLDVPAADLVLEEQSRSTWENARNVAALLQRSSSNVVLVTSAGHMRRASLYFRHFGIDATPVASDVVDVRLTLFPNSANLLYADLALHEYIGLARYHVYSALGWNN